MHVLIVEDTPEVVEIIDVALKLRWAECEVTSVDRGGLAPGIVASARPDLIMLDLGLPDVDGIDLLLEFLGASRPDWPPGVPYTAWVAGPVPVSVEGAELVPEDEFHYGNGVQAADAAAAGVVIRFRPGVVRLRYKQ